MVILQKGVPGSHTISACRNPLLRMTLTYATLFVQAQIVVSCDLIFSTQEYSILGGRESIPHAKFASELLLLVIGIKFPRQFPTYFDVPLKLKS